MSMLRKRIIFGIFVMLDLLFLIVSVLSWNIYLSICCFVLAILLTRFFEDVGLGQYYTGKQIRKQIKTGQTETKNKVI